MQQPPGQGWPQQLQQQLGYGQPPTSYGQPSSSYPQQQGQWAQQPYTPYPPQQGQLQQPITPDPQWSQQAYWQTPPQQPKKKGKLKWVFISLGIILVLSIGACAMLSSAFNYAAKHPTIGNVSTDTTSSSSNTTSSDTSSSSNSTTTQVGKVGDTITIDSVSCTLISVKTLSGDEFTQPKPGNELIVVHVKIHNSNSQQTDYNTFDFHAKSGAGNVTDEELIPPGSYTANNELNSGQLDPGGTVEGDIIFQVPIGDNKAELTWQPNFFRNTTQNAWNLGL